MNRENAEQLATRIVNTWRSTPPRDEWIDVLLPLEIERAKRTFELCRMTITGRLDIAQLIPIYRQQPTDHGPRDVCTTCDGEGYLHVYFERNGHEYDGLSICRDCDGTYNPPLHEHVPPRHIGRQIAYQAYAEECMRAGRKPDPAWFDRLLGEAAERHPTAHTR